MKSVFRRLKSDVAILAALSLSGCARPVLEVEGIYFPSWLVAVAIALPPAILLGRPLQRKFLPERRWIREPLEIALFVVLFVVIYLLLTAPLGSTP